MARRPALPTLPGHQRRRRGCACRSLAVIADLALQHAANDVTSSLAVLADGTLQYSAAAAAALAADGAAASAVPAASAASLASGVLDSLAASSPAALQPLVRLLVGDVESLLALSPTLPAIVRLSAIYYFLLARPNPLIAILDFYLLGKLPGLSKMDNMRASDFQLRDRLGGGNFGTAYEALRVLPGETVGRSDPLTASQKKRRVVLKRVNMDKGDEVRTNFLKTGTMAKGAAETGFVEAYMCDKISRSPLVAGNCAEFMGTFTSKESEGAFVKGSQWLVWKFESDCTLSDALDGQLGEFPYCLERFLLGSVPESMPADKRETMVIKTIFKQVLVGLSRLHSIGIIHRDIKPENLLVTVEGQILIIDFGAAVDLCTGINFNPLFGMLDPRYSPPEELVMPKTFPRYPTPFISSLLSPLVWLYGAPDLFDSYSAGILLVQMSVPQLRNMKTSRGLNQELSQADFDLQRWRDMRGSKYDFSLLDRNNKAGWELATMLICKRNTLKRGRLSADEALAHRYFRPEF